MAGCLHRVELFEPLLDRKLFLVVVIFGEEITVLATKVAAVGDVDGANRKLRQTEGKQPGDIAELTQFSFDVHAAAHYAKVATFTQPAKPRLRLLRPGSNSKYSF
jgi:hypothetical protein